MRFNRAFEMDPRAFENSQNGREIAEYYIVQKENSMNSRYLKVRSVGEATPPSPMYYTILICMTKG